MGPMLTPNTGNTALTGGIALKKRRRNKEYLMSLRTDLLLLPYYQEAGLIHWKRRTTDVFCELPPGSPLPGWKTGVHGVFSGEEAIINPTGKYRRRLRRRSEAKGPVSQDDAGLFALKKILCAIQSTARYVVYCVFLC